MSVFCQCDECDNPTTNVVCTQCARDRAPKDIRNWLDKERLKPGSDVTPEIAAIFERCAEDLE